MTCEATESEGVAIGKGGRFYLAYVNIDVRNWRTGWNWIKSIADEMGWWPVIYGMDVWFNRVPIIRTTIAVNILVWIILWVLR